MSKKRDEFDVGHSEGRRWNYVRLTLPPYIPESKLELCDIIELDYQFQFRIELSGGGEVRLETPFWIGAQPQVSWETKRTELLVFGLIKVPLDAIMVIICLYFKMCRTWISSNQD